MAIARFVDDASVAKDPLFAQVFARRSLKEPYDLARPVDDGVLQTLVAAAGPGVLTDTTNELAMVQQLRQLTDDAMRREFETPHTYKESVDLFRIGKAEIEANPDGIDFSGWFFEGLHTFGLFNREVVLDPESTSFKQGLESQTELAHTAMAHVWLVTETNTRLDQIAAGRAWLRVNLAATAAGVGTQPMSQALQEFPEMAQYYAQAHELLAPNGGTVQMLGRLGYGADVPPSPRWAVESRTIMA